jgi:hypothetical protein
MRDTNRGRTAPSPIRLLIPYSSLLPNSVGSLRTFRTPVLFIPRSGNVPRQESRYIGREAPLTSKSFIPQFRSVSRYEAVFKPSLACQFGCKHVEEGWPDEAASPPKSTDPSCTIGGKICARSACSHSSAASAISDSNPSNPRPFPRLILYTQRKWYARTSPKFSHHPKQRITPTKHCCKHAKDR